MNTLIFAFTSYFYIAFLIKFDTFVKTEEKTPQLTFTFRLFIRFVGTTSESTDLFPFLQNLTQHIKKAKGEYAFRVEVGVDV